MADIPNTKRTDKSVERQPVGTTQNLDDLKKRLTDEYKILQDKIDKIGAFRFTIKGWAIAVVGAAVAASTATKSLAAAIIVTVGLGTSVVFFFFLEVEQVRLSRLFGYRAGQIEQAFSEIDNRGLRKQFPSPTIGTAIVKAKKYRNRLNRFRWWMFWKYTGEKGRTSRQAWLRKLGEDWAVTKSAHIKFYVFLLIFTLTPVAAQHNAVRKKISNVWSYYNPSPPALPAASNTLPGSAAR